MTDRYDADKEILGYVPDYRRIADALGPAARVCEIGVGHGASMRMWQDMYPQGLIAGVDLGRPRSGRKAPSGSSSARMTRDCRGSSGSTRKPGT